MTEAELAGFYPKDYWGSDGQPTEDWIRESQSEKTRFLASCGLPQGRILDVGCGSGFFLRALDPRKWDRFGVETGGAAAAAHQEQQAAGDDEAKMARHGGSRSTRGTPDKPSLPERRGDAGGCRKRSFGLVPGPKTPRFVDAGAFRGNPPAEDPPPPQGPRP